MHLEFLLEDMLLVLEVKGCKVNRPKQKPPCLVVVFTSVAGQGVEPCLQDYAFCNLRFLGVSDYILSSLAVRPQRIVSTDSHLTGESFLGVTMSLLGCRFHRYS